MLKVPDKQTMYELYNRGKFGNRLRTWPTLAAMMEEYRGPIGLRYSGPAMVNKPFRTMMNRTEAISEYGMWMRELRIESRHIVWCEAVDPKAVVIQGDLVRAIGGLHVLYSTDKGDWRQAMKSAGVHTAATGLRANLLLKHYMDDNSYHDVMDLLDEYDSIIEFSVFNRDVGVCPRRNTLIWEVRNY